MTSRGAPPWLVELLDAITTDEVLALTEYRAHIGKAHQLHAAGKLRHNLVTSVWIRSLNELTDATPNPTPALADYRQQQLTRLERWATGGTTHQCPPGRCPYCAARQPNEQEAS